MAPVVAGSIPVTHPTFLPIMFGSLAQLAEHLTLNQGVTGSIPVRSTIFLSFDSPIYRIFSVDR